MLTADDGYVGHEGNRDHEPSTAPPTPQPPNLRMDRQPPRLAIYRVAGGGGWTSSADTIPHAGTARPATACVW